MPTDLLIPLALLALVDSTSFGTLLVPLWLMLAPGRPRARNLGLFLAAAAFFYLLLGVLLLAGIITVADVIGRLLDNRPVRIVQVVAGAGLMLLGAVMEPWTKEGKQKKRARREAKRRDNPGRVTRFRNRAGTGTLSPAQLVGLALGATAVEAGTMLPYFAALGLLAGSGIGLGKASVILVGYCLVMITPALVLMGLRIGFHRRLTPALQRIEGWMTRHSGEATAWIVFLFGLFLTSDATQALFGPGG